MICFYFLTVQEFIRALRRVATNMRFVIANPCFFDIIDDSPAGYVKMIENVSRKMNPMMILCVVPNNNLDRYSAIKIKCCVNYPIPTQVLLSKACKKTPRGNINLSVATKVAIQMNCKVGGIPWIINIPTKKGWMVVGFDTYKDSCNRGLNFGKLITVGFN